jgi:ABC-type dipeptide/oligopeptide/nickel transport system ATPase component
MPTIAELNDLKVYFYDQRDKRFIRAVENAGFSIEEGSILGIVGESGCGKTVTALTMMGLLSSEPGIVKGEFFLKPRAEDMPALGHALGREGPGYRKGNLFNLLHGLDRYVSFERDPFTIVKDTEKWLRRRERVMIHIRGRNISMVFQNPWLSLNPFMPVGRQLESTIRRFDRQRTGREVRERAVELLKSVRLRQPELILAMYPGSLSIGMAQRVVLAIALASNPRLLIADEPTTGLDMTNVYKVIELLEELRTDRNLTLLLISHDVGVVGTIANRIAVMYAGHIVETGPKGDVLRRGGFHHPYTDALLSSVPEEPSGLSVPSDLSGSTGLPGSSGVSVPSGYSEMPDVRNATGFDNSTASEYLSGRTGVHGAEERKLSFVEGRTPDNRGECPGCPFLERCPRAAGRIRELCLTGCPGFFEVEPGHFVRCFLFGGPA